MPAVLKSRAGIGDTIRQLSTPNTVRKTAFIPVHAEDNSPTPERMAKGDYETMQINLDANRANLSPEYLQQLEALPEKERQRFLFGNQQTGGSRPGAWFSTSEPHFRHIWHCTQESSSATLPSSRKGTLH
ncbi:MULTISPECIES: hypothetical protein [Gluconobacter]|uniref:hypothetical protein n=1 Tax=Gluconobacter TaxID=441 RepID=UPI0039ECE4D8